MTPAYQHSSPFLRLAPDAVLLKIEATAAHLGQSITSLLDQAANGDGPLAHVLRVLTPVEQALPGDVLIVRDRSDAGDLLFEVLGTCGPGSRTAMAHVAAECAGETDRSAVLRPDVHWTATGPGAALPVIH